MRKIKKATDIHIVHPKPQTIRKLGAARQLDIERRRRESTAVREIIKELRALGYKPIKNHGSPHSQRGRPDIEVMIRFRLLPFAVPFYIEVKRATGKLRAQQKRRLIELQREGGVALVATNWSAVERAIARTRQDIIRFFTVLGEKNNVGT